MRLDAAADAASDKVVLAAAVGVDITAPALGPLSGLPVRPSTLARVDDIALAFLACRVDRRDEPGVAVDLSA